MKHSRIDDISFLINDLETLLEISNYIIYPLIDKDEYQKKLKKLIKQLKKDPSKVLRKGIDYYG